MKKKWIKFIKDFKNPSDDKEFKKDSIVEIDEATADSLVGLKYAEITEAPSEKELLEKSFGQMVDNLQKSLETMVVEAVNKVSKNVDDRVKSIVRVTKEETPEEHYSRLWKSEGDFLQAVIKSSQGGQVDERFTTKSPTGLNTLDDVDGGFLIPDTMASGIWTNMRDNEMSLMGRTDQRSTSGNNLKFNTMRETSRKSGYRHAGMVAYWTAEAAEFTASQPKFNRFGLDLHKLTALYYCTDEELDDASVSIPGVVNRLATQAMMFLVNEALYDGTGVGKPTGILRTDALITVVPEAGQVDTILHQNINKMYYRLAPQYRAGAVWLVHPNVEEKLPFIQFNDDTTGRPVPIYFPPGTDGLSKSPVFGRMMGLPVIPFEHCKDLNYPGDICLANWGEYITLTKAGQGIKQASSIHLRFLYEETAFRFSFRVGGGTPHSAPVEDLNGTQTRGPFVVLGNRSATPISSGL